MALGKNPLFHISTFMLAHRIPLGVLALCLTAGVILTAYTPYWQGGEDPLFSMFINGYGAAGSPSIHIPGCNFLWSLFVQAMPDFFNIQNYTWAIYGLTFASIIATWLCLAKFEGLFLPKSLMVMAMLFYSFLHPQFSVTASFCGIAGILCLFVYIRFSSPAYLIGFLFILFSFIVREMSFFLIAIIGLFLYPCKRLITNRQLLAFSAAFCVALASVFYIDYYGKSSTDMLEINRWQKEKISLADKEMAGLYPKDNSVQPNHDLTKNDMGLSQSQFSADASLGDMNRLNVLATVTSEPVWHNGRLGMGVKALNFFLSSYPLWLLSLGVVVLFIRACDVKTCATVFLFLGIFFSTGYFNWGGASVPRIYYPAIFWLISLLSIQAPHNTLKKYVSLSDPCCVLFLSILMIFTILGFSKSNLIQKYNFSFYNIAESARALDKSVWFGWHDPIEAIYRPFANMVELHDIRFQSVGWTALLPNSVTFFDVYDKNGFKEFLMEGFTLTGDKHNLEVLEAYCHERLNGNLISSSLSLPDTFKKFHILCVPRR